MPKLRSGYFLSKLNSPSSSLALAPHARRLKAESVALAVTGMDKLSFGPDNLHGEEAPAMIAAIDEVRGALGLTFHGEELLTAQMAAVGGSRFVVTALHGLLSKEAAPLVSRVPE